MKPSDRIKEIHEGICKIHKCHPNSEMANTYGYKELAIIQFLDEQYEKDHPSGTIMD